MNYIDHRQLEKESVIVGQIEQMLKVRYILPSETERERFALEFKKFAQWADKQGLGFLPASGHVVAAFLLDIISAGAASEDVEHAAAGIVFAHELARQYLDLAPIRAALDVARFDLAAT
jgi:hypothetical protein